VVIAPSMAEQNRIETRFLAMDANVDGRVTLEEMEIIYRRDAIRAFHLQDGNLDGVLDASELKAAK
jgi:hypothetical protein